MNIIEMLVDKKIASNAFHAAGMLNVLECYTLKTDAERLARCELYKAWKLAGENKAEARKNAIAGLPVPELQLVTENWNCKCVLVPTDKAEAE